jgi:hypothetical protein
MQLELDEVDAEALGWALDSRVRDLTRELARTEQHNLQHELAQVVTRLEQIAGRLQALRAGQPARLASSR